MSLVRLRWLEPNASPRLSEPRASAGAPATMRSRACAAVSASTLTAGPALQLPSLALFRNRR